MNRRSPEEPPATEAPSEPAPGSFARDLHEVGGQVQACYPRAAPGGRESGIAGARGHVEHVLARRSTALSHHDIGDGLDRAGDVGVGARRPRGALALGELLGGSGHGCASLVRLRRRYSLASATIAPNSRAR